MKFPRVLKMLGAGVFRLHFSQFGEDVILHKLFGRKFSNGFYVDIGAHHPFRQSNTAYLWMMGWRGINVDASRTSIAAFNKTRADDLNIWSAVVDPATAAGKTEIELFSSQDLDLCATCDPQLANERGASRSTLVPCTTLKSIINDRAAKLTKSIEVMNIDIEGFDQAAIADMAEWTIKPKVICIEIYENSVREVLASPACALLEGFGYTMICRVGPTAIFELRTA